MQMIGVSPAQADHPVSAGGMRRTQVFGEFEPLVAADQRIDQVKAQHGNLNPGLLQPVHVQTLQGRMGPPVNQGQHRDRFR